METIGVGFLSAKWTEPVCFSLSRQKFDPETVKGFTSKCEELKDGQKTNRKRIAASDTGFLIAYVASKGLVHCWSHGRKCHLSLATNLFLQKQEVSNCRCTVTTRLFFVTAFLFQLEVAERAEQCGWGTNLLQ